jgi:hypothetical protein
MTTATSFRQGPAWTFRGRPCVVTAERQDQVTVRYLDMVQLPVMMSARTFDHGSRMIRGTVGEYWRMVAEFVEMGLDQESAQKRAIKVIK